MGLPPAESVDNDVRDVMGELANMIAGNLNSAFAPGIRVSIPSVTDGASYNVRVCGPQAACQAAFHTEAGPLWITLIESLGMPGHS
jgi:CheY-specific phosphatase CheX